MHGRTLIQLRGAFVVLGILLLAPLWFLLRGAQARLEEQRRLRHEIVAERIFDEMERALTVLLEREGARPSAAYDAESTRVESWSPFVVGYFTRDAGGAHVIAQSQLAQVRVAHVESAAQTSWQQALAALPVEPDAAIQVAPPEPLLDETKSKSPTPATEKPAIQGSPAKATQQETFLRRLNRAAKVRAKSAEKNQGKSASESDDPLEGLDL